MSILGQQNKASKEVEMLKPKDLRLLINFFESRRKLFHENTVKIFPAYEWWLETAKATMISILLANCASFQDLESLTINDYSQVKKIEGMLNQKMLQCLEPKFQDVVKNYYFLANNKTAKILIISKMQKDSIDLVMKNRKRMNIHDNPYVFAVPSAKKSEVLKCCLMLKDYARDSDARYLDLLNVENLQPFKNMCRFLNTGVNETLINMLFDYDLSYRYIAIGQIGILLLDVTNVYKENGFFEMKALEQRIINTYGKPQGKTIKSNKDDYSKDAFDFDELEF